MPTAKSSQGGAVPRNRRKRNKKQKVRQVLARKQHVSIQGNGQLRLSECALKYAHAISSPFSSKAFGSCIPDVLSLPSLKMVARSTGFFSAGSSGFAFVAFNPWLMVSDSTTTNATGTNAPICVSTTGWSVSSMPLTYDSTITNVQWFGSNSQYTTAGLLAGGYQLRLVGAGLRVRYTGTELQRSGRLIFFRSPTNTVNAVQGLTPNAALFNNAFHTIAVSREWTEVCYAPSRQTDLQYNSYEAPATGAEDFRIMAAMVDGTTANNPFEFECIAHFEVQADVVGLNISPSHADPVGMGAILASVPQRLVASGGKMLNTVLSKTMDALGHSVSGFVSSKIGSAIGGYFGGPIGAAAGGLLQIAAAGPTVSDLD